MIGDIGGYLDAKNRASVAAWAWRWHAQGGSKHWAARPLMDLRNAEDLRRYRGIELKRRRSPFGRRVVSLAAFKFERERQKVIKRLGVGA